MKRNLFRTLKAACALFALAMAATPTRAAGVSGAIFTTTVNGGAVNANQYESKCGVYLDGGPGPHAPAKAAGLPDGDYYFQVTDPSGAQLLSTDPVSNRRFHVTGGVITAFTGAGGSPHPTGLDQDHMAQGAITIGLANGNCPRDFLDTPQISGIYKVWVTPVGSFAGNPANVDNPCNGACSHGFLPSQSKTDNFKIQPGSSATFCLTIQKQFSENGTAPILDTIGGWVMSVIDPTGSQVGGINTTDTSGNTATVCQLGSGTYTITENATGPVPVVCSPQQPDGATTPQVLLNGSPIGTGSTTITFTWDASQPANITVVFVNGLDCAS